MELAVIALGLVLAWDASRRWAERNDEYDPEDHEELWKTVKVAEETMSMVAKKLRDHDQVLVSHADNLKAHGQLLTNLGLKKTGIK